ncbi:peptide deformylase [Terasakiispira papahanaumokuakeensis]|uniref:Peptide deformylase n=1 Tax=Terasakiispira papahanaumokuakeensis TaxID=197479 RepID=A0A1E2VBW7_9GAMM|nr:peptide deformylase [Terasakiispira papahanaumokuakeensis]ODC04479.1 peptide deformylase [Terasakiispira papahanaumokuakeensis]
MAILNILEYPDPRLRTQAAPMTEADFTPALQQQIDDMFETMYDAPGIGLAATQVDFHKQLIVIDVSETRDQPLVLINPSYEPVDEQRCMMQEGCLSVPEYYAEVERAVTIRLKALDRHGKPFEMECTDLLAHCVQHECDHLKGIVFVDYLSKLKQDRVRKKMEKRHKLQA